MPETISVVDNNDKKTSVIDEWKFILYFINLETNQYENTGKTFDSKIITDIVEYERTFLLSEKILIDDTNGEYVSVEIAKENIENKENIDFSTTSEIDEGLHATLDDYGISYYFRGNVEDNYVEFADMLWRIVRIDGAGNIKLMLYNENIEATFYWGMNISKNVKFNDNYDNVGYSGYMYSIDEQHGNEESSNVKNILETWYKENLLEDYNQYIAKDVVYCTDRTVYSRSNDFVYTTMDFIATGTSMYYGSYKRIIAAFTSGQEPSLICPLAEDNFSAEKTDVGNGKLTYPIALISADEISMAGAASTIENYEFYLYTGVSYWTISPGWFSKSAPYVILMYSKGYFSNSIVASSYVIFPSISLKSDIEYISGNGTLENPYKINQNI